jgi:hypothetical protein
MSSGPGPEDIHGRLHGARGEAVAEVEELAGDALVASVRIFRGQL